MDNINGIEIQACGIVLLETPKCVISAGKLMESLGPGGMGRIMFIIPTFMHFQMKHELPEEHRHC